VPEQANPAGAGSAAGSSTGVSFFEVPGQGESVVYLVDRSLSMEIKGYLELARRELLASLERLPASTRFQVIFYNRTAEPLCIGGRSGLLPASLEVKREAAAQLASVPAAGATDHVAALREALALQPDVLFLVTDADDMSLEQVQTITRLNQGRTTLHTLAFDHRAAAGEGPLQTLARLNRGSYRLVNR
jgi:hypothetical protein